MVTGLLGNRSSYVNRLILVSQSLKMMYVCKQDNMLEIVNVNDADDVTYYKIAQ